MSRLALKAIQAAAGNAGEAVYVDDVFSTYVYEGNGSTQTINNGIDLDGEGGLVWIKERTDTAGHRLYDTERGDYKFLESNTNIAEGTNSNQVSFNSNGFSTGSSVNTNNSGDDYVSWTFRKQPGFFDVVKYTGTATSPTDTSQYQDISHNLGTTPGMIIVKKLDSIDGLQSWIVNHRAFDGSSKYITLNSTSKTSTSDKYFGTNLGSGDHSSTFRVVCDDAVNQSGSEYIAYLFAHDAQDFGADSDEAIIKCGSFTGNPTTINLGFEPQWMIAKKYDSTSPWQMFDIMRGWTADGGTQDLEANSSSAEIDRTSNNYTQLKSDGVTFNSYGGSWMYVAIRRPHKPASEFAATDLFTPTLASNVTEAGGKIFSTTFPVDWTIQRQHTQTANFFVNDRPRGGGNNTAYIQTNTTNAEANFGSVTMEFDHMDGVYSTTVFNWAGPRIFYALRRAPEFFDVVAYTGTGSNRTVSHNLNAVPELMIVKVRSQSNSWAVYSATLPATDRLRLESSGGASSIPAYWNSTAPTSSVFTVGTDAGTNLSGGTFIAYLFASVDGISKVGGYTGTGSNVDVNCGFTSGARFVLVKRTDSTGDWYLWDSVRGIVAGNDPYLLLNTNAGQVTSTDYIDPLSSGFTITSSAPSALNASGGEYVFLAIA